MRVVKRFAAVSAVALLCTACASAGGTTAGVVPRPRPFPVPTSAPDGATVGKPGGTENREPGTGNVEPARAFDGYALVGTALALRGTPYRNGGTDPRGFDCSGFTRYVFEQYGVSLPRDVADQFKQGKSVKPDAIAPGDLIFFSTTTAGASHVAIAVGGDEFVHAPSSAGVVRVEHLSSSYWAPRFLGIRRVS